MAITEFYTGKSDANLPKDAILKSGALMVQRIIHEVTASYNDAAPNGEFTLPASVGTISDDDFNSTGKNLEFVDDDGDVCAVEISDTTGTTKLLKFVIANAKKVSDGTAAALTDGSSYSVRVMTPTQTDDLFSGAYGKYFGYVTALSFEPINEKAQLKIDIPKELVLEGDLENGYSVNGAVSNPASDDIMKAIFGAAEFGVQTAQYSIGWGANNAARSFYRIFIVSQDENGRENAFAFLRGRFGVNGAMEIISDEFKSVAWKFSGFSDGMYPEAANLFLKIRKD